MTRYRLLGLAGCALLVLSLGAQFSVRLNGDAAYMLYSAGQVLDGSVLYVDILDVNPPLAFWIDLPLVAISRWLSLDPILVFRVAVTSLLAMSVVGIWWVRASGLPASHRARRFGDSAGELAPVVFALFVLPRLDWGEREHLALALMLPWLALAARRWEGLTVSGTMALTTGLAAGIGIALKPHFVLIWVGRAIAIWAAGRSDSRKDGQSDAPLMRWADSWAPVLVCVAYLVAAILSTPEYFLLVRELAGPYSRFIRATFLQTMFGPAPAVALAALAVVAGLRRPLRAEPACRRAVAGILWWTTAAWALVAVLQVKGFRYHWYPAMALGFLLLYQLALVARGMHISLTARLFRAIATATVFTTSVFTIWDTARQAATPRSPEWDSDPSVGLLLEALEDRVEPGDTLAVLSPNMASGFPLTNYLGTVWPLRMPHVWPAIVSYTEALERGESPELRPADNMEPLERWSVGIVEQDLQRSYPEWLLVFRHLPGNASAHMAKLDLAAYLKRSPAIAQIWQGYDSLGTVGMYSVWEARRGEESPPIDDVQGPRAGSVRASARIRVADLAALGGVLFLAALALDMIVGRALESRRSSILA